MIDYKIASRIVLGALREVTHIPQPDLDSSLDSTGLPSSDYRLVFRNLVQVGVRSYGCYISESDIPIEEDVTVREVILAVSNSALPGTSTIGDDNV
jgi:hypothetical protein